MQKQNLGAVSLKKFKKIMNKDRFDKKKKEALKKEENIRNNQMKYVKPDLFYINRHQSISIEDFINLIFKNTKMSISTLINSIIYIDKFCEINKYILSLKNVHRILIASCLLSIKFNEDTISTKYYSKIVGTNDCDLNNLELYFYIKLQFSLLFP